MTNKTAAVAVPTATNNAAFACAIVQALDALSAKRKVWESGDFKKANEGLYLLLSECLDTFQNKFLTASDDDRKSLRSELCALLTTAGVKVQKNTTTLNMLVRFVFSSDRKRAHGYAYVLAAAISHGTPAQKLPEWICESGGIEEIKRKMVKSAEAIAKAQRVEAARGKVGTEVEQAVIAPLAQVSLKVSGDYAILLCKPQPDGTVSIIGALPDVNDALFNALLMRIARHRAKSDFDAAAASKEAQDLMDGRTAVTQAHALTA